VPVESTSGGPDARRKWTTALAGAVLLGASLTAFRASSRPAQATDAPRGKPQVVFAIEKDGLRYEFNAVMGTSTLHDVSADDRRNLLAERPAEAAALQRALLDDAGADSLEALRAPHRAIIESLQHLGYL
jgi:hypothetical protein